MDYIDKVYIQTSRKCYWGKCTFCDHSFCHTNHNNNTRSPDNIIKDIEYNKSINTKADYGFADDELRQEFLVDFSNKIISNNIAVTFRSFIRADEWLDYEMLKLARKAGFINLALGIESFLPRLRNKILYKGVSQERIFKILDHCKKLGIRLRIMLIVGIPTQTKEELLKECNYIYLLLQMYPNTKIQISHMAIFENTPMHLSPDKFGISLYNSKRLHLSPVIPFKQVNKDAISPEQKEKILCSSIRKNLEYGNRLVEFF
jgi:radical SAM superfamily enzyme YgiQ (UPF0313 family)